MLQPTLKAQGDIDSDGIVQKPQDLVTSEQSQG